MSNRSHIYHKLKSWIETNRKWAINNRAHTMREVENFNELFDDLEKFNEENFND